MRRRDVLEDEVHSVLSAARSSHKLGQDGRIEVRGRIRGKQLLVIYRRDGGGDIIVINVIWETR